MLAADALAPVGAGRARWWRRRDVRRFLWQFALAVALVGALAWLVGNVRANLPRMGIQFGFGFLAETASFDIGENLIGFQPGQSIFRAFLAGLANTLQVAALGIVLATALGAAVALARLSPNWLLARGAWLYVETFRNTPLLLQLLLIHTTFARVLPPPREAWSPLAGVFLSNRGLQVPRLQAEPDAIWTLVALVIGIAAATILYVHRRRRQARTGTPPRIAGATLMLVVVAPAIVLAATGAPVAVERPVLQGFNFRGGLVVSPEFATILIGLVLYSAAFMAETMRAGILGVRRGQIDAARSLGMTRAQVLRLVTVPQALRIIVPPLTSQYLSLTKNSSLAVAVGYPDVVRVYTVVAADTGRPIECIAIVVAVYLTLSLLTAAFMAWYNRRNAFVER